MESYHSIGTGLDWVIIVIYFLAVTAFGMYFSKYNRSTNDFFFGGRRFSWWLIAFSIVATGVSSHSFVKYSAKGFENGISSTMTYMNDWFFVPLFFFGWLPIVIYSKIKSIPEYFERRFSKTARGFATIFMLAYIIGYIGIGFLTLAKALMPLLPEHFNLFGIEIKVTLMGIVVVTAIFTGLYITVGGQTAVIFTDLVQGFILLFAGVLLFVLGISYIGGLDTFWHLLPPSWRLPFADFNNPPNFNFVGIFWQDGVDGSIAFLFMNMGLMMRFMATKSVNEGRKAATFNIFFMLPLSALVVGNAGWLAKAISEMNPNLINPNVNPDQVFIVLSNLIAKPGIFGFIIAALLSALMSTVSTFVNATAAIYIYDIHHPIKEYLRKRKNNEKTEAKEELGAARYASIVMTTLGALTVIPFSQFPTVYEAHGFFHSTLTPPLVVAIFFGVLWKKFTPAAVVSSLIGGVALMILGAKFPDALISPLAHGTIKDPAHPFIYIGALYNTLSCVVIGVIVTLLQSKLRKAIDYLKTHGDIKKPIIIMDVIAAILFIAIIFIHMNLYIALLLDVVLFLSVALTSTYYVKYDEEKHTDGLTIWSVARAKEMFKGSKPNEIEGEKVKVNYEVLDNEDDVMYFSQSDMEKMAANEGDLVYLSDARAILGGLKSVHSVFGKPHFEDGKVYISKEHLASAQFVEGKILIAEKEM